MYSKKRKFMVIFVVLLFLFSGLLFNNFVNENGKIGDVKVNGAANNQEKLADSYKNKLEVHSISEKQMNILTARNYKVPVPTQQVTVKFIFSDYNPSQGSLCVDLIKSTSNGISSTTRTTSNSFLNITMPAGQYNYSISLVNTTSFSSETINFNELNGTINTSSSLTYPVKLPNVYLESLVYKSNLIPIEVNEENIYMYNPETKISSNINYYSYTMNPSFLMMNGTYNTQISLNLETVHPTLTFSGSNVNQKTITFQDFHAFTLELSNFPYSADYYYEICKNSFSMAIPGLINISSVDQLHTFYIPNGTFKVSLGISNFEGSETLQTNKVLNLTGISLYVYYIPTLHPYKIPVNGEKQLSINLMDQNLSIIISDSYSSTSISGNLNLYGFNSTMLVEVNYESYRANQSSELLVSTFQSLSLNFSQVYVNISGIYKNGSFGMAILTHPFVNSSFVYSDNGPAFLTSKNEINVTLPNHEDEMLLYDFNGSVRYVQAVDINPSVTHSYSFSPPNSYYGEVAVTNVPTNEESIYVNSTNQTQFSCFTGYGTETVSNSSSATFKMPEIQGKNNFEVSVRLSNSQLIGVSGRANVNSNGNLTKIEIPKLDKFYLDVGNYNVKGLFNILILSNFKMSSSGFSQLSSTLPNYTAIIGEIEIKGNGTTDVYMPSGDYYSYFVLSDILTITEVKLSNITVTSDATINLNLPNFSVLVMEKSGVGIFVSSISVSGSNFISEIPSGIFSSNGLLFGLFSPYDIQGIPYIVPRNTEVTISASSCVSGVYVNPPEQSLYTGNAVNYFAITISFTNVKEYKVDFIAKNLGNGVEWKVNVFNKTSSVGVNSSSNSSCIYFYLPDGSYNYTILVNNSQYKANVSNGNFSISGHGINITVSFETYQKIAAKYMVIFHEKGLSSGMGWSVTIGTLISFSTESSICVNETNGTYSYSVYNINGYSLTNGSGSFNVNGKNVYVNVTFTKIKITPLRYNVTFNEKGLASGVRWYIIFNNTNMSTTNASISFNVPNGTYTYRSGNVNGYNVTPINGNVNVKGQNVSISITYTAIQSKTSPNKTSAPGSPNILSDYIYLIIAIAAVAIIAAAVIIMRRGGSP